MNAINLLSAKLLVGIRKSAQQARSLLREESGQGTTEYAILVGVLVVIAILAIVAFRGKIQTLWDEIVNGFDQM